MRRWSMCWALAAFGGWWALSGDAWRALDVAISVLVITCPCALGLAVPAVSTVATGRLFRLGLLVKSQTALERLADIDIVAFDKTGTLTTGAARLAGAPDAAALALAAGLASGSAHPYSRAILAAAEARGIAPVPVAGLTEVAGRGVEGEVLGRRVRLGHPGWLGLGGEGVALADGAGGTHRFAFHEELRPEAAAAVAALRARGIEVAILSGDGAEAVARIAGELGVGTALSRQSPEGKAAWLRGARGRGAARPDGRRRAERHRRAGGRACLARARLGARGGAQSRRRGDGLGRARPGRGADRDRAAQPGADAPEHRHRAHLQLRGDPGRARGAGLAAARGAGDVAVLADGDVERGPEVAVNVLAILIPVSVGLGLAGVAAFLWSLRAAQYDDPEGDSRRILDERWDGAPAASRTDVSGDPPIYDRKESCANPPEGVG